MLNGERATKELASNLDAYDTATGAVIFNGGLVVLDAGKAKAGAPIAGAVTIGVAIKTARQADGDARVETKRGTFLLKNSAGADEIVAADIGAPAYVVDAETVAKTSDTNARPKAGMIRNVDASGVWVSIL